MANLDQGIMRGIKSLSRVFLADVTVHSTRQIDRRLILDKITVLAHTVVPHFVT